MTGFAQTNDKVRVVFFGDSITELGIKENGYIREIEALIGRAGVADRYELIGAGKSGDKVYDLYFRAGPDVVSRSPDVVVIFVGVNDIWHKRLLGTGTDFDKFGRFYEALADKLTLAGAKLILCTPAVIGERTDHANEFDGELNLYSEWVRNFAAKKGYALVDLRKAFLDYLKSANKDNKPSGILTTDKVHLNKDGNRLVAEHIWQAIRELRLER